MYEFTETLSLPKYYEIFSLKYIHTLLDNELGLFLPKACLYENVEKIGQLSFKPPFKACSLIQNFVEMVRLL